MLKKNIKANIEAKIKDWLESISDNALVIKLKEHIIVTGGCITSMVLGEEVNDYDVYIDNANLCKELAQYYISQFTNKDKQSWDGCSAVIDADRVKIECEYGYIKTGLKEKKIPEYYPVCFSENAITLSNDIQIVTRFTGSPDKIHENYDFEHTKAVYYSGDMSLSIPESVYDCIINKTLRYSGSKYPLCSLFRMRKFIKRGWNINAGQILKAAYQASQLDFEDINVLKEQLVGVDSMFFTSLIDDLENMLQGGESEEDTTLILSSVVFEAIEKVFD